MEEDAFRKQFPFESGEGQLGCSEGALVQLGIPSESTLVIWFLRARAARGELSIACDFLEGSRAARSELSHRPWPTGPEAGRLTLHGLNPDTAYRFRVTLDGASFELMARTAPAASSRRAFRFLAFSCFAPFSSDAAEPVTKAAERTLAQLEAVSRRPRAILPDFALGLGDQVYVDDGGYKWFPPGRSLLKGKHSEQLRYRGESRELFETLYRAHFSLGPFDRTLRAIPSALIWDDHEIRDGWGSQGDERARAQDAPYRAHLDAARGFFLGCQALRNPNLSKPEAEAQLSALAPDATWPETHFSFDWGEDTTLFVMDQRSARSYDAEDERGQVISAAQLAALSAWLERDKQRPGRLYVLVSPIPLTQPAWSPLDPMRWLSFRADDTRDRFWHALRRAQGAEILERLVARFRDAPHDRLLILSGDVHYHEVRELSVDGGRRVIGHEVISSGLAQGSFFEIYRKVHEWNEHRPVFRETGLFSKSLGRHLGPGFAELTVAPQLVPVAAGDARAQAVRSAPKLFVFFHLADRRGEGIDPPDPCEEAYELTLEAPVTDAPDVVRAFLHPRGRTRLRAAFARELEQLASRRTARPRRDDDSWYKGRDRTSLFGLALSGGGIRSATLSLGFLRRLHQAGYLRHADYLSTVSGGSYTNGYLQASAWVAARTPAPPGESGNGDPLDSAFSEARIAWLKERGSYLALGAGAKGSFNKARLIATYAGTLLAHWASLLSALFFVGCLVSALDLGRSGYLPTALHLLLFGGLVTFAFRLFLSQISDRAAVAGTRVEGVLSMFETAALLPLLAIAGLLAMGRFVPWAFSWPEVVARWAEAAARQSWPHLAWSAGLAFAAGLLVQWSTGHKAAPITRLGRCLWTGLKYTALVLLSLAALSAFGRLAPAFLAMFSRLDHAYAKIAVSFLVMLLLWAITSPNSTSMHRYFAARITDTFLRVQARRALGEREPEGPRADLSRVTQHKQRRELRLMKLHDLRNSAAPYPLFNACVNLMGQDDEAFAGVRASDYFVFAPDHCGAKLLGYASTCEGQRYESVSVAEAVGCSAAAISPFQGRAALSPSAILLWLLNLRTDMWLPHPTGGARAAKRGPSERMIPWGPVHQVRALFGRLDTRQAVVNISDGGFIDNLGLIELLRRRCRLIIALDNTWDPRYEFKELRNAVVRARQELGLSIEFVDEPERTLKPSAASGLSRHCFAVANVSTPEGHPEPWQGGGLLVYVKACELMGKRVRSHGELRSRSDLAYRTFHPDFPQESTADQFFNAEQWRAYFELGSVLADAVLGQALTFDPRAVENRGRARTDPPVSMHALLTRFHACARRDKEDPPC